MTLNTGSITIAIRRENETEKFEARVPITPKDVIYIRNLVGDKINFTIQPSNLRCFTDSDYIAAGATVQESMHDADVICCVKELDKEKLLDDKIYLVFAHVIKGQPDNMPLLQQILKQRITLIDYESIINEKGDRTVFFGKSAGQAGMIESLRAFGLRCAFFDIPTVFQEIMPLYKYKDLNDAKGHISSLADKLVKNPSLLGVFDCPLVVAIAGFGNVGKGAADILSLLSPQMMNPCDLNSLFMANHSGLFQCNLQKPDLLRNKFGGFDVSEYSKSPLDCKSILPSFIQHITILLNCVFWSAGLPRILPRDDFQACWQVGTNKLQVIGDLSCDPPDGSVACTIQCGDLYDPIFGYDPKTNQITDCFSANGVTVMAVDNLSAGLPVDSSVSFSSMLRDLILPLVTAKISGSAWLEALPPALSGAVVTHQGALTEKFNYLNLCIENKVSNSNFLVMPS